METLMLMSKNELYGYKEKCSAEDLALLGCCPLRFVPSYKKVQSLLALLRHFLLKPAMMTRVIIESSGGQRRATTTTTTTATTITYS